MVFINLAFVLNELTDARWPDRGFCGDLMWAGLFKVGALKVTLPCKAKRVSRWHLSTSYEGDVVLNFLNPNA
jgi:hypothetical protein